MTARHRQLPRPAHQGLGCMGLLLPACPRSFLLDPLTGEPAPGGRDLHRPVGASDQPHDRLMLAPRSATPNRPALHHFHTGDIAVRDDNGYLTYVGRNDDIFKSIGRHLAPSSLRASLVEHPSVVEAAGPRPLRAPTRGAEGVRRACRGRRADQRDRARHPDLRAPTTSLPTDGSGGSSSSTCPDTPPARLRPLSRRQREERIARGEETAHECARRPDPRRACRGRNRVATVGGSPRVGRQTLGGPRPRVRVQGSFLLSSVAGS